MTAVTALADARLRIEPLTDSDIEAAMQLVVAAGWNQLPSDWQRVIAYQPWGCFKATIDGQLVGTVTSTAYGHKLAWIGMMLVDPSWRRQGIGRALMQEVIAVLRCANVQTIKLDATPAGQPLYEELGFIAQFPFQRWRRETQALSTPYELTATLPLNEMSEVDRAAFGVEREAWLSRVAATSRVIVQPTAYGMLREGRIAAYLGPVVGSSSDVVNELIGRLVASTPSAIFWDIPRTDAGVDAMARRLGFEPVRVLTRMVLRHDATYPQVEWQFAICDPACG